MKHLHAFMKNKMLPSVFYNEDNASTEHAQGR
jgi:hypothetical protein